VSVLRRLPTATWRFVRASPINAIAAALVLLIVLAVSSTTSLGSASASAPGPTWERSSGLEISDAAGAADGSVVVTGYRSPEAMLRSFDAAGNVVWDAPVTMAAPQFGNLTVARFGDGSVAVAGTTLNGDDITFDPAGAAATVKSPFVARYLADGSFSWAYSVTTGGVRGAYPDRVLQALTLPDGGVRFSLEIARGEATFDALGGPQSRSVTGPGAYTVDYRPDGSITSLASAPVWIDARFLYAMGIGRADDGTIVLYAVDVLSPFSEVFVRFDSQGAVASEKEAAPTPQHAARLGAAGPDGSLFVAIDARVACPADAAPQVAFGFARLNPDLSVNWFRAGDASVGFVGIHPGDDGSVVLAGTTAATTTFGSGTDAATIDAVGFVARVDAAGRLTELGHHPTNWFTIAVTAGPKLYGIAWPSQPPSGPASLVDQFDRAEIAVATPGPSGRGCPGDPGDPAASAATPAAATPVAAQPSFTG
jgi:hypothetical protein